MFNSLKFLVPTVLALGVSFTPAVSSAKVIVKESTSYYNIVGKTGADLNKAMLKRGPNRTKLSHAIASTESKIEFKNFKFAVRGRSCVIEDVDVILKLKYTLPRWNNSKKASAQVQKGWKKFNGLLVRHENQHGKISKDAAQSIEREFKRLRGKVSKNCNDFGKKAASRFARIGRTLQIRQRNFDRREGFGFSAIARSQKKLHRLK